MGKLTLDVDEVVLRRARRYAARRGTSVSRLVVQFLSLVYEMESRGDDDLPPTLKRLRAEMKGVSVNIAWHTDHLKRKYR